MTCRVDKTNNVARGRAIEMKVKAYLEQQGLTFITNNYYTRFGEIDLVFRDGLVWIFVEVKFRQSAQYGLAEDAFTKQKRQRLTKAIQFFVAQYNINLQHHDHRIDLFAINGNRAKWYKAV